jgi:hypothetical protein
LRFYDSSEMDLDIARRLPLSSRPNMHRTTTQMSRMVMRRPGADA